MQARILEGDKLRTTTDPAQIRAALAEDKRIWIDLERQTPDADALLAEVLKLHPLTIATSGPSARGRRSTTSTTTST